VLQADFYNVYFNCENDGGIYPMAEQIESNLTNQRAKALCCIAELIFSF
jgi:hypothetical protein